MLSALLIEEHEASADFDEALPMSVVAFPLAMSFTEREREHLSESSEVSVTTPADR